jgi:hypothetical protein
LSGGISSGGILSTNNFTDLDYNRIFVEDLALKAYRKYKVQGITAVSKIKRFERCLEYLPGSEYSCAEPGPRCFY